ncbi:hypothetical protein GCM10010421_22280 [Streptomyces glaucus]|uniref:Uncharacterized protein n=1 Tax=Streptomyces glaucus TaxID=284029 RepID=A0ABN3JKR6_9ACTN
MPDGRREPVQPAGARLPDGTTQAPRFPAAAAGKEERSRAAPVRGSPYAGGSVTAAVTLPPGALPAGRRGPTNVRGATGE